MRITALLLVSTLPALSCTAGRPTGAPVSAADVTVVDAQSYPPAGCRDLGPFAVTDGALELSNDCSCERPEVIDGTEAGAIALATATAARMGANAIWVLKVVPSHAVITHTELCCSVTGIRLYAVAFDCEANIRGSTPSDSVP